MSKKSDRRTLPPLAKGGRMWSVRKLVNSLAGAQMCFGEPVRAGDHVVLPIARVRAMGGGGFGDGDSPADDGSRNTGSGGGGGGYVDAAPVGFIEIGPDGARFQPIPDPITTARALSAAVATLAGAALGVRVLRGNRKAVPAARRLLRRGQLG